MSAMAAGGGVHGVELAVVLFFFVVVTAGGFLAVRWRRAASMNSLDEWGLGGRGFGTWVTWFLLGGDLYTAYTFVAVPAAMWATGAVTGFFAVPYTIVLYPIIFFFLGRMWSIAHTHGYVTTADFVSLNETPCVSCGRCAETCPVGALMPRPRILETYQLDVSRCIFCGICADACPYDALRCGPEFEFSEYQRDLPMLDILEMSDRERPTR